jgi:hypothetical protein
MVVQLMTDMIVEEAQVIIFCRLQKNQNLKLIWAGDADFK